MLLGHWPPGAAALYRWSAIPPFASIPVFKYPHAARVVLLWLVRWTEAGLSLPFYQATAVTLLPDLSL